MSRLVWPKRVLANIRRLKKEIRKVTKERVDSYGLESIPIELNSPVSGNMNSYVDWWGQFERHAKGKGPHSPMAPPFMRTGTPWDAYAAGRDTTNYPAVPGEAAPLPIQTNLPALTPRR